MRKCSQLGAENKAIERRRGLLARSLQGLLAGTIGVGALAPAAYSQNWVGNGTSPYWDVATNWSGGVVPGSGANVTNNTTNSITYRQNNDTVNSFDSTLFGAFSVTGGILSIVTSFTTNGAYTQSGGTLNAGSFSTSGAVSLTSGTLSVGSFNQTGSGPLTLSGGTLTDTGAFTTSAPMTLSGTTFSASSFNTSGAFTMTSGTMTIGSFVSTSSTASTFSGGTINDSGAFTTSAGFTLNGGTIQSATFTNPSLLSFSNSTSNILDNVTLSGSNGLTINVVPVTNVIQAYARIDDAFSFTSGAIFNVGTTFVNTGDGPNYDYLLFDSTTGTPNPTFNNATVNLGSSSSSTGYLGFGNGFNNTTNTLTFGSGLVVQGKGTIGNTGVFSATGANLVNNGTISANIASNTLNVTGATNGNITNGATGVMQADASAATLTITPGTGGTFINNGIVEASNSGVVYLQGNIPTLGALATSSGGAVALNGGTITGAISSASATALSFSNSTSNILDNVTLSGSNGLTINVVPVTNVIQAYARIDDAFSFTSGAIFNVGTTFVNTGDGPNYDYLLFDSTTGTPNPTFNNATVNLGSSSSSTGYLGFGNGFNNTTNTLTFGSGLVVQGKGTIGNTGVFSATGANLVNNGTISANIASNTLNVTGATNGNITNGATGVMQADASAATLTITPGTGGTFINNGIVEASNSGVVYLQGNIPTLGALATSSGGAVALNGGTITGAISSASATALSFSNSTSNILDNVTLSGSNGLTINVVPVTNVIQAYARIDDAFSFTSGAIFNVGTTFVNTGDGPNYDYLLFDSTTGTPNPTFNNATVNLGSSSSSTGYLGFGNGFNNTTNTLTFGSGLVVQGKGTIGNTGVFSATGANLVNNGTISANIASNTLNVTGATNGNITNGATGVMQADASGATLNITTSGTGIFTNTGTVLATGSSFVTISGSNPTLGTVQATNSGIVYLSGTIPTVGNGLSVVSGGIIALNNATVSGTVPSLLSFSNSTSNILDNVTLSGSNGLTINVVPVTNVIQAYARIDDAFSFTSGAIFNVGTTFVNTGDGPNYDYLLFDSTTGTPNPTFNNATVNLGSSSSSTGYLGFGNGFNNTTNTLTFGSGLVVQGKGTIGNTGVFSATGANLVNNGTISANIASNTLNVTGATNGNITNGATGVMQADASGSSLTITPAGTGFFTNAGTVQATASAATVTISANGAEPFTNTGTLLATGGGKVTVNAASLTNSGTMEVDSGSTLALDSTSSTQTAGTTIVKGSLTISNSNSNFFTLQGGAVYGTGAITGSLVNSGAIVGAGIQSGTQTTGTLTLTGNYYQVPGGAFSAALSGATQSTLYDFFNVSGTATLGGNLDVDLLNNFVPVSGETFQIIKDSGNTGTFSNTINNDVLDNSGAYQFLISYASNGVTLTYEGAEVLPEPGAVGLMLFGAIPGVIGFVVRRRRKGRTV